MRTFEKSIVANMYGKGCLPPFRIKYLIAFGTNKFLLCEIFPREEDNEHNKNSYGNSYRPPGNVVMSVKPIHTAGCERKYKCDYKKYYCSFFHFLPHLSL